MASTLTWLDYSERDRRDAMVVIDLFRETGTVDELGLSRVQFSIANLLFPGTSTIQTRACYFLLVPWMYKELERKRIASDKAGTQARRSELAINRLLRSGPDRGGVFGSLAGDSLKRLPSDVYWDGLRSWGIRSFRGYISTYFRSLDGFYRRGAQHRNMPQDPESRSAPPSNWHPHLPEPPTGFPESGVAVALRRGDAQYLREQIMARHPESLLAVLARRADTEDLGAERPWQLANRREVPSVLRERLFDAERFAVVMQGAALLYNLMLAELREHEEWIDKYQEAIADWANRIRSLDPVLDGWQPDRVWSMAMAAGTSPGYPTRAFVEHWVEILNAGGAGTVADKRSEARSLVRDREIQLKRSRARMINPRRLELWGGASGTWLMDFRWGSAKRLLRDIFDGLAEDGDDARNP